MKLVHNIIISSRVLRARMLIAIIMHYNVIYIHIYRMYNALVHYA